MSRICAKVANEGVAKAAVLHLVGRFASFEHLFAGGNYVFVFEAGKEHERAFPAGTVFTPTVSLGEREQSPGATAAQPADRGAEPDLNQDQFEDALEQRERGG